MPFLLENLGLDSFLIILSFDVGYGHDGLVVVVVMVVVVVVMVVVVVVAAAVGEVVKTRMSLR